MIRPDRLPGVLLVTDNPRLRAPEATVSPERVALFEAAAPDNDVVCLASRYTAGLGVQALWSPSRRLTYVTVTLNGATETFTVPSAELFEAFKHPYAYGATLPL